LEEVNREDVDDVVDLEEEAVPVVEEVVPVVVVDVPVVVVPVVEEPAVPVAVVAVEDGYPDIVVRFRMLP
jgi:hypothetical protein